MLSSPLHDLNPHVNRKDIVQLNIVWTEVNAIPAPAPLPCEQRLVTLSIESCDRRSIANLIDYTNANGSDTFVWSDGCVTKRLESGRKIMFNAPVLAQRTTALTPALRKQAEIALEFDL